MTITIERRCVITGEPYKVEVPKEGYEKWIGGMLIQDALPDLSTSDREFLISSISPKGWELAFGLTED